jgi:hypothetical protein
VDGERPVAFDADDDPAVVSTAGLGVAAAGGLEGFMERDLASLPASASDDRGRAPHGW